MKIAVTGGSGFIGGRFISLFNDKVEIISLNSKNCPLDNYELIKNATRNVDIIIHTAFDHQYKNNINGIKNILKACEENKIKKLVHISTVSVYDPYFAGELNENVKYSSLNDPYSQEKILIEKEIDKLSNKSFDIVILQPSIVYGVGGNWTKYALHACKSKGLILSNNGEFICNPIYVDDVATAIYQACISNVRYGKFLISGLNTVEWKYFYLGHSKMLDNLNLPTNIIVIDDKTTRDFHNNIVINSIFQLWFFTPFGKVMNSIVDILKRIREKKYTNILEKNSLLNFLKAPVGQDILQPSGITKLVHKSKYTINGSKANEFLQFKPEFSFDEGMKQIRINLGNILK